MSNSTTIDSRQFRAALGSFTTGVTVVTTRSVAGEDVGLTANSFNSVSLDPPMVLWSLDRRSSTAAAFMAAEHFAVHILAADQEQVSNQFAARGVDRFAGLAVERGHGDVPLIAGCSARFECRTSYRHDGGDHVIFVGEVVAFDSFGRAPLVFHGGNYGLLMKKKAQDVEDTRSSFGDEWLGFLLGRAYYQMLMPLRAEVQRQGLDDIHYRILSALSTGEGRSVTELSRLVEFSGHRVVDEHFATLAERELIVVDGEQVRFTEAGRRYAIELMAAGKSAEADAAGELDFNEARLLKLLLKRVIRATGQGLPEHWRKENIWRDNNVWGAAGGATEGSST
ncbi:flavin reductase [Ottowia sp.]|jgi:3-hydroxy-9,10-secoandrosta-1,3,5(10)-triene-9,17-dione monooxygenase reductase component|uniref:flavin reductase n=1 Tax=Ottowia sp. TaxID=1898956 RepID=UPI0025D574E8|nr:flavin reductase [Ottowia sp.]MBK6615742.1 flavin reductase family protein [Ottowia sp.]MBK6746789.1 flavin reductase family protein [Ottowia sp.]